MCCKINILRMKTNVVDHRKIKLITIRKKISNSNLCTHAPRNCSISSGSRPGTDFTVPKPVRVCCWNTVEKFQNELCSCWNKPYVM